MLKCCRVATKTERKDSNALFSKRQELLGFNTSDIVFDSNVHIYLSSTMGSYSQPKSKTPKSWKSFAEMKKIADIIINGFDTKI